MKNCTWCKKPGSFLRDSRRRDGLQSHCKDCQNKRAHAWRLRNLEKVRHYDRIRRKTPIDLAEKAAYDRKYRKQPHRVKTNRDFLLKKYWPHGTYEQAVENHAALFEKQKGCCNICGIHQSSLKKALCIDHDHSSGAVRGLLCDSCNRALGLLKEKSDILSNAIHYLKKAQNG